VGDIVVILNDSGEQIMPIDECYIVHGHAPRVVQLNGSRWPSCAGPIIAGSRSRANANTHAVRRILHFTSAGELVTMLGQRASQTVQRWTSIDLRFLNVIIGLKSVECLQRRRQLSGSTPMTLKKQITVECCQRCDCRVALRLQISLLKVFYCGGDLPPNVKRNQLRQATTTTGVL
jgi:hypothetical protein